MYRSRSLPRYIILYSMWQELSNNLLIGMLIAFMVMELQYSQRDVYILHAYERGIRMSRDFFPWILRGISVDFA